MSRHAPAPAVPPGAPTGFGNAACRRLTTDSAGTGDPALHKATVWHLYVTSLQQIRDKIPRPPTAKRSTLLSRLLARSSATTAERPLLEGRPPRLPDGVRVYAIGDIHGRHDLLERIELAVVEDLSRSSRLVRPVLVYLGDYVDRGIAGRQVLEHLARNEILEGIPRVLLRGNHDLWFREFLRGEPIGESWLQYGGEATLLSYGVPLDPKLSLGQRLGRAAEILAERVPATHLALLDGLEVAFALGDYFFCHAGIRPGIPLARQSENDLLWIREPFLSWSGDHEKIVVHGHTIAEQPQLRRNRIGIDTGAYSTGVLTCLVLEGTDIRFLRTVPD